MPDLLQLAPAARDRGPEHILTSGACLCLALVPYSSPAITSDGEQAGALFVYITDVLFTADQNSHRSAPASDASRQRSFAPSPDMARAYPPRIPRLRRLPLAASRSSLSVPAALAPLVHRNRQVTFLRCVP